MAARTLFLACFLSAVFAVASAVFSPLELALRTAITNPAITSFVLKGNILLTADLPTLPDNKAFTVTGSVGKGKKAKIDGAGKYLIFRNSGNAPTSLTLSNLIITGAKATFPAVSLSVLGTKLTATNVDFQKNPQALFLTSVDGVITKCTFSGHTLSAISLEAEEGDPDKVTIVGSTFTNNKGLSGAGVDCGKYTTLEVSGSKFTGNSVSYRGGAIRVRESASAKISSSSFTSNTAQDQGGAITVFNAGITISSSTFTNNVAKTSYGGALRVGSTDGFGAAASVSSSTFSGNKAKAGGAFVMDTNVDSTTISFCKTTFSKNTPNDGFLIGATNTILTKNSTPLPAVVVKDTGAILTTGADPTCK